MKEKLKGLIVGILIGTLMTATIANAATLYDVINQGIKIVVDGKRLNPTDANGKTVEPIIYNGTTYLPVRAIASALGKEVYWDGPNYTVYLGEMDGKLEYPTVEMENMTSIADSPSKASGNQLKDNYGNVYERAISIGSYEKKYEYLLNMKYSRFRGTFYILEGEGSSYSRTLKIIADGKTIYTSPQMTHTSAPVSVDVNIRGYNHLIIEIDGGGYYGMRTGLANAGFYQ